MSHRAVSHLHSTQGLKLRIVRQKIHYREASQLFSFPSGSEKGIMVKNEEKTHEWAF